MRTHSIKNTFYNNLLVLMSPEIGAGAGGSASAPWFKKRRSPAWPCHGLGEWCLCHIIIHICRMSHHHTHMSYITSSYTYVVCHIIIHICRMSHHHDAWPCHGRSSWQYTLYLKREHIVHLIREHILYLKGFVATARRAAIASFLTCCSENTFYGQATHSIVREHILWWQENTF